MTSVWWVVPLSVHPGSLVSSVSRSAGLPVSVEGVEVEEVPSFFVVAAVEGPDAWGAVT